MEDSNLENKCEHLMNIVVETRKHYGKMCVDYAQKIATTEDHITKLQIKTYSNINFKKYTLPAEDEKEREDLECFTSELLQRSKRIGELKKKVKDTQVVVNQLKSDRNRFLLGVRQSSYASNMVKH